MLDVLLYMHPTSNFVSSVGLTQHHIASFPGVFSSCLHACDFSFLLMYIAHPPPFLPSTLSCLYTVKSSISNTASFHSCPHVSVTLITCILLSSTTFFSSSILNCRLWAFVFRHFNLVFMLEL
ncbi:unnamed protein product [Meganyctiphanes norvegica]|uniref:Uncharacterized protein n=1 Tax=Meganyctiphanes norvegica TaxID=48144 RepID=A0AAV2SQY3_MEGNR